MTTTSELKTELGNLQLPAERAIADFRLSLPEITNMVNERLRIADACSGPGASPAEMSLVNDFQTHFGRLLLAVYEFGLYPCLVDEMTWYADVLRSRQISPTGVYRLVESWEMAILARLAPPGAGELSRPLTLLKRHADVQTYGAPAPESKLDPEVDDFLKLLLQQKRRDAAKYALGEVKTGTVLGVCDRLIFPALSRVGRLWQHNKITVAGEHAATDICRYVIFRLFDSAPRSAAVPWSALVACVPGDEHELGPEVLASYLDLQGWTTWFIGHSTPEDDLVRSAVELKPDVVFLAAHMIEHLPLTRSLIRRLRAQEPGARIVLGGPAIRPVQAALAQLVSAFGTDITSACTAALKLVQEHA